jgi:hypothetical protein
LSRVLQLFVKQGIYRSQLLLRFVSTTAQANRNGNYQEEKDFICSQIV